MDTIKVYLLIIIIGVIISTFNEGSTYNYNSPVEEEAYWDSIYP